MRIFPSILEDLPNGTAHSPRQTSLTLVSLGPKQRPFHPTNLLLTARLSRQKTQVVSPEYWYMFGIYVKLTPFNDTVEMAGPVGTPLAHATAWQVPPIPCSEPEDGWDFGLLVTVFTNNISTKGIRFQHVLRPCRTKRKTRCVPIRHWYELMVTSLNAW